MFASRHTSKIDRPPSACLKIRILSSVLYFLPFIRLVPFGPDYLIPRLEKAQSRHYEADFDGANRMGTDRRPRPVCESGLALLPGYGRWHRLRPRGTLLVSCSHSTRLISRAARLS